MWLILPKRRFGYFTPEHHLILLDVMMENMSGYQMADILRNERHNNTPIIFLTAKNTENDILTGFNLGADDYISKPFSLKEVLARVKAVLNRRTIPEKAKETIIFGTLEINLENGTVMISGKAIELTKKEFQILVLLARYPNRFLSREEILEAVWERDTYVLDRSVDVHVARLRKKMGVAGEMIVNKTGFGYCIKK